MERRILIAGSGGQGIIFMGEILSLSAMLEGKEITSFPSYGVEKIGGFARCTVIISEEMIGSPVSETIDILIVMNKQALERFKTKIAPGGMLFYDSSMTEPSLPDSSIRKIKVPALDRAVSFNNLKGTNMVMLGAFAAQTGLIKLSTLLNALDIVTPEHRKDAIAINKKLLREGYLIIEDKKSED